MPQWIRAWVRSRRMLLAELYESSARLEEVRGEHTILQDVHVTVLADRDSLREHLADARRAHAKTRRLLQEAQVDCAELREQLAAPLYRHGDPARPRSTRAEVLAEKARADALAQRVDLLQAANIAAIDYR